MSLDYFDGPWLGWMTYDYSDAHQPLEITFTGGAGPAKMATPLSAQFITAQPIVFCLMNAGLVSGGVGSWRFFGDAMDYYTLKGSYRRERPTGAAYDYGTFELKRAALRLQEINVTLKNSSKSSTINVFIKPEVGFDNIELTPGRSVAITFDSQKEYSFDLKSNNKQNTIKCKIYLAKGNPSTISRKKRLRGTGWIGKSKHAEPSNPNGGLSFSIKPVPVGKRPPLTATRLSHAGKAV
ncbi:hypothetical protein Clacol_010146 [Clathrus columnatus]|uniref:Uncharacterized protein n=1 Tax=Clathrus columnatus TaxID=1419009 RepID=A0AAV5ATA2_9AGAM|nr:hypothetical protein Clacol_010146 [Clathrus columnatus]